MKISRLLSALSLSVLVVISSSQASFASEIPILTWEQGKLQNVVLGGGEKKSSWNVEMVSSSGLITSLEPSSSSKDNFVVFSVVIPRDFPIGGYTLFARGLAGESTRVAVVNVVEAKSYEIGRVPGDLIYVFVLFIGAISAVIALRGKRSSLKFLSSIAPRERFINREPTEGFIQGVHDIGTLERIRISVQQTFSEGNLGNLGNLVKANSSILHFRSRRLWSIFPLMLGSLGIYVAVDSPREFGYLILLLCLFGNLDIFSGIVAAVTFVSFATFSTEVFSFSSILGFVFIASLFFIPNFIALMLSVIFGTQINKFDWINITLIGLVVHFLVLMQRSLLPESYFTTPQELLVMVSIVLSILVCDLLDVKRTIVANLRLPVEDVELDADFSFSRAGLLTFSVAVFSVVYVWSMNGGLAILVAVVALFPILVSRIEIAKMANSIRMNLPRKPAYEILFVCIATYLVFIGLSRLPIVTYSVLETLLLAGFIPVFIHSLYVAAAFNSAAKVARTVQ
jgi:hypothetical protein